MSSQYVLDSFAILALLQKEQGHERVFEILDESKKGTSQVMMTWVNVGEVVYTIQRRWDKFKVHKVLANLETSNIEFVDAGQELSLKAADYKASFPIAYADAFAAALADMNAFVLVTGDPEFKMLEERISIEWL